MILSIRGAKGEKDLAIKFLISSYILSFFFPFLILRFVEVRADEYLRPHEDRITGSEGGCDKDGMVTCNLHHTRRKAVYCKRVPVLNAAKEVLGYVYQCTKHDECSSAARRGGKERAAHNSPTAGNLFSGVLDCSSSSVSMPSVANRVTDGFHARGTPRKGLLPETDGSGIGEEKQGDDAGVPVGSHDLRLGREMGDEYGDGVEKSRIPSGAGVERGRTAEENVEDGKAARVPSESTQSGKSLSAASTAKGESSLHMPQWRVESSSPYSAGSVGDATTVTGAGGGGGGNRYFELLERGPRAGTNSAGLHGELLSVRKVCWDCGLSGHERTTCTNTLCRSCHAIKWAEGRGSSNAHFRHPGSHTCLPVPISDFIFPFTALPTNVPLGMAHVECVRCGELGHFDCGSLLLQSLPRSREMLTCCYCACTGHTAYDCSTRESEHADRWVQRMLRERQSQASHSSDGSSQHSNEYRSAGRLTSSSSHSYRDRKGWIENDGYSSRSGNGLNHSRSVSYSPSSYSYSQSALWSSHDPLPSPVHRRASNYRHHENYALSSYPHHSNNRRESDETFDHSSPSYLHNSSSPSSNSSTHRRKRHRGNPDEPRSENSSDREEWKKGGSHPQGSDSVGDGEERVRHRLQFGV